MDCLLTVVISTHGKRRCWLQDVIDSMYFYNDLQFELVIIDNASEDDTLEYLDKLNSYRKIKIIANSKNFDDTVAMNQALALVSTKYFLKIDSDVIFCKHSIINSSLLFIKSSQVSMIGPYWDLSLTRKNEIFSWPGVENTKALLRKATLNASVINHHFDVTMRLPRGNYLLMNMADILSVGGFDERYKHNAMEYPLAMRLIEAGLDYAEFNDPGVIHKPSIEQRIEMRNNVSFMF